MNKKEYLNYLRECGFEESELESKWQDVLLTRKRMKENQNKEQREITSSSYKRTVRKNENQVERLMKRR